MKTLTEHDDEFEMKVGHTYSVKWEDCCVTGQFTATLEKLEMDTATFSNGVWLDSLWGYQFEEVK